uniref:Uncharacterized protein n=1 Tax=Arundo donax TaxID=35708 RepID=A0A0A8Z3N4_ARUDO
MVVEEMTGEQRRVHKQIVNKRRLKGRIQNL